MSIAFRCEEDLLKKWYNADTAKEYELGTLALSSKDNVLMVNPQRKNHVLMQQIGTGVTSSASSASLFADLPTCGCTVSDQMHCRDCAKANVHSQ